MTYQSSWSEAAVSPGHRVNVHSVYARVQLHMGHWAPTPDWKGSTRDSFGRQRLHYVPGWVQAGGYR